MTTRNKLYHSWPRTIGFITAGHGHQTLMQAFLQLNAKYKKSRYTMEWIVSNDDTQHANMLAVKFSNC